MKRQDELDSWDEWIKRSEGAQPSWESPEYLKARQLLEANGVSSLWHMTHKKNLRGILADGILSHNEARSTRTIFDISDSDVQQRRDTVEPIFGRNLREYAPLYVNIRNPMLYLRRELNAELCLLEISLDVLRDTSSKCLICTDGNAASGATRFYFGVEHFEKLPWDVLQADYWSDITDGKRKRCAEVLIHPSISSRHIEKIHCCLPSLQEELAGLHHNVTLNPPLFFGV